MLNIKEVNREKMRGYLFPFTLEYSNWAWTPSTSHHPRNGELIWQWMWQKNYVETLKAFGSWCYTRVDKGDINEVNSHLTLEDIGKSKNLYTLSHNAYQFEVLNESEVIVYAGSTGTEGAFGRHSEFYKFYPAYKNHSKKEKEDRLQHKFTVPKHVMDVIVEARKTQLVVNQLKVESNRRKNIIADWEQRKHNRHVQKLIKEIFSE